MLSRLFVVLCILSIIWSVIVVVQIKRGEDDRKAKGYLATHDEFVTLIALETFCFSSIGTASTILFGWRSDHREREEIQI